MHLPDTIKTEDEYEQALLEVERLFNSPAGTREGETLDKLVDLVMAYEEKHFRIGTINDE